MNQIVKTGLMAAGIGFLGMNAVAQSPAAQSSNNSKTAVKMEKKFKSINGLKMAYVETGKGDPIIFLHGNPTSSYVWRNIIPWVKDLGHCIAPDLMGMGDSDKFPDSSSYTFAENQKYLEALYAALNVKKNITFVVYDWGSALAFDWARRHPHAVKGIVYMEAIVRNRPWSGSIPGGTTTVQRHALRKRGGDGIAAKHFHRGQPSQDHSSSLVTRRDGRIPPAFPGAR